jgi:hypothetical protein
VGIRESLNKNPAITTGATVAIILLAICVIMWEVLPSRGLRASTKAYFTDDDGATYFSDDVTKVAPFDHDGKEAVRCYVFTCPGHGKFVGYLEKFTKDTQTKILARLAVPGAPPIDQMELNMGRRLKKPGDSKWVPVQSPAGQAITDVKCPDDPSALITPEMP